MSTPKDEGPEENPVEEVHAESCGATPDECEIGPGERDNPPEDCAFTAHDELSEQFPVEPIPIVIAKDGMIQPVDVALNYAPPFTHEHVVCIEDKRTYVELFEDELWGHGWTRCLTPETRGWIRRALSWLLRALLWLITLGMLRGRRIVGPKRSMMWLPEGSMLDDAGWLQMSDRLVVRSRFSHRGFEQDDDREEFKPEERSFRWGVELAISEDVIVPIRPIRERCEYYKRQVFNNDEQPNPEEPGHRVHFTNCTKRRSIGGAFLSLRDQAVYACDHRQPPDPKTVAKHLEAFDNKRLSDKGHQTLVPLFGLEGEDMDVSE